VQKTICWPKLGCALRIYSEAGTGSSYSAMTQHYPTTVANDAV